MALFDLEWDGIGFTSNDALTEMEISEEKSDILTEQLRAKGVLPPYVRKVIGAHTSPDDGGLEDGEYKIFVNVRLTVEAADEASAERMEAPEALLREVVGLMLGQGAYDEIGVDGSFEVLLVDEIADELAA